MAFLNCCQQLTHEWMATVQSIIYVGVKGIGNIVSMV